MSIAPRPENERQRLAALETYRILDTPREPIFDAFAELAAETCGAPIALVSLVDESRQWFKASVGLALPEGPRDDAFCAHALTVPDILEVPDTLLDARFANNPLVTSEPYIRFYAGVPLVDRDGCALGTLCVIDDRPRTLAAHQRATLRRLARSIVALIEARAGASREALEQLALVTRALDASAEPMAIVDIRADGPRATIVFVNRAFGDLFEYAATEIVGRAPDTLFGARTDAERIGRLRAASAAGEAASETVFLYSKTGRERLIEIRDRAIDGTFRIVTLKDLTHAFAARRALADAHRRLRSLFSNNTDAVLTLDTAGRCVDANPMAATLLGASREHVLGDGVARLVRNGVFAAGEPFPSTLLAGTPLQYRRDLELADGRTIATECKAIPIVAQDGCDGAFLIVRDVSNAVSAANLIAEQAKRTRALCIIAATNGTNETQRIDAALATVLEALDMEFGYVGEIVGDALHIRHVSGQRLVTRGATIPLDATYVRETLAHGSTLAIDDLASPTMRRAGVPSYGGWHGYVSTPLRIEGRLYGALGFLARRPMQFAEGDREFVTLVAALVATSLERELQRERLDRLAYFDALTGLPNRAHIMDTLEQSAIARSSPGGFVGVFFIDLDGFKAVNDRLGHAAGDEVLREVGRRLRQVVRVDDTPGRLGGDEFVVLQSDVATLAEPEALGRRVVAALSQPYRASGETLHLSASVGIAIYPDDGDDVAALLKRADEGLYRAKAAGKSRVVCTS
ncbi:MAG: hypothetical protein NVSMB21_06990 [Vulcanimicrobiaceae bacterium]